MVEMHSGHRLVLSLSFCPVFYIILRIREYTIVKPWYTVQFCCGVSSDINPKSISLEISSQSSSRALILRVLSEWVLLMFFFMNFTFFRKRVIVLVRSSSVSFRKDNFAWCLSRSHLLKNNNYSTFTSVRFMCFWGCSSFDPIYIFAPAI